MYPQACVSASPVGVAAVSELLGSSLEVLRNEALLLLVGLCTDCPELGGVVAFEGGLELLLGICGAEGGPAGGCVIVADAAELINNLLRGSLANQRLMRCVHVCLCVLMCVIMCVHMRVC